MAKAELPIIRNWDDVNQALKEICECEIATSAITAELNTAVNIAQEKADKLSAPHKKCIDALKNVVQVFVEDAKEDMQGKTKALNFGKVGFRESSSISIPDDKEEQKAIIKALQKRKMIECINIKETISKTALKKYPDDVLAKVGISREVEDTFFLETNIKK